MSFLKLFYICFCQLNILGREGLYCYALSCGIELFKYRVSAHSIIIFGLSKAPSLRRKDYLTMGLPKFIYAGIPRGLDKVCLIRDARSRTTLSQPTFFFLTYIAMMANHIQFVHDDDGIF